MCTGWGFRDNMKNLSWFLKKKKSALIILIKFLMCYYARRGKNDPE